MKLGVIIPTYQTENTPFFVRRAIDSLRSQTHKDWKLFFIGDNYEDEDEFKRLPLVIPKDKITLFNWTGETERNIYGRPYNRKNYKLWCSAGIMAKNRGIDIALSEGYDRICRLDHDDYWTPDHLELISEAFERDDYLIVATLAKHINLNIILPKEKKNPFFPRPNDLCNSATCVNFARTPLRMRDVYAETGKAYPGDADLWIRMTNYMAANKIKGYLVDKITTIKG